MVFNPRSGAPAPNSVGAQELQDNAVTEPKISADAVTGPKIANDAVGSTELADDAVVSSKIAADAVISTKIAAGAVGEGKIAPGVIFSDPIGVNKDFNVVGTTSKRVERIEFFKDSGNKRNLKKLRVYCDLKTSNVTHAASIEAWLDNDGDWDGSDLYIGAGSPDAVETSTSVALEAKVLEIDISALSNGKHVLNLSLKSADAGESAETSAREYVFSTQSA